jgi:hypothetical protein
LLRTTSPPFRYTTASSSRSNCNVKPVTSEGSATVNVLRKYVVMNLIVAAVGHTASTVQRIALASSPSP